MLITLELTARGYRYNNGYYSYSVPHGESSQERELNNLVNMFFQVVKDQVECQQRDILLGRTPL